MDDPVHKPQGMMAQWPNDDLCLQESTLQHLRETFPRVAPIFEASDLHTLFRKHEGPANLAKKKARLWGKVAICFGLASIILAATLPVLLLLVPSHQEDLVRWLGMLVCLMTVFGVAIGLWMALYGKTKQEWMQNRLLTERLRQFHFQSIINNLPIVLEAIETQNFDEWRAARAKALSIFSSFSMKDVSEALVKVLDDEGEEEAWLNPDWSQSQKLKERQLDNDFIVAWREQRLGVQLRYTRRTLAGNGGGKRQQAKTMQDIITILTVGALATSFFLAILYFLDAEGLIVAIAQSILAIFGGGSIAARAFEEGMNFKAERDCMEWYLAALEGIGNRFSNAKNANEHVELMRELERLSYQEMHRYFVSMDRASFIM